MSRTIIIDGYNMLHTIDRWAEISREEKRQQFLKYLDSGRFTGSSRNTLIIVLDGYAAALEKMTFKHVRLVFSQDQDADTVIKRHVETVVRPGDCLVVTNDKAVRVAVKGLGASVMTCEEFLSGSKKNRKRSLAAKSVDPRLEESINFQMKRIWKIDP